MEKLDQPIRIMLVEDHAPFRRAMAALLSRQPDLEVVAEAGSREEARHSASSVLVDVAVLDFGLPDGDGADVIRDLRRAGSRAAVIVLSNTLDPSNFEKVTEAGASEVLAKFTTNDEIISAIRRIGVAG